jgi:hypothetical protein
VDNTSDINKPVSTAQNAAIQNVKTIIDNHTTNTGVHVTETNKAEWNSKAKSIVKKITLLTSDWELNEGYYT